VDKGVLVDKVLAVVGKIPTATAEMQRCLSANALLVVVVEPPPPQPNIEYSRVAGRTRRDGTGTDTKSTPSCIGAACLLLQ
jgi:hypothetical protein